MKIILDNIIFSIQKSGGISVRWKEFLDYLYKNIPNQNIYYIQYPNSKYNIYYDEILNKIPSNKIIDKGNSYFTRIFDCRIDLKEKFIFHSSYYKVSSNSNAINVIIFHDCIQELFGRGIRNRIAILQKKRAVKNSDHIICNSYSTKNDLIKLYNYPKNKISMIYNGVNPIFRRIDSIKKNNNNLLFIGSRAWYKRFDFVIELLKNNLNLSLTIVGGGEFSKIELKLIKPVRDRIQHFIGINEYKLNELYNAALCLIHPSMYEGFGITIIEAMRAGCPVIAFKSTVVSEIAENACLLFGGYNVTIVNDLIKRMQDHDINATFVKIAYKVSKKYSWDETGKKTFQLLGRLSSTSLLVNK